MGPVVVVGLGLSDVGDESLVEVDSVGPEEVGSVGDEESVLEGEALGSVVPLRLEVGSGEPVVGDKEPVRAGVDVGSSDTVVALPAGVEVGFEVTLESGDVVELPPLVEEPVETEMLETTPLLLGTPESTGALVTVTDEHPPMRPTPPLKRLLSPHA